MDQSNEIWKPVVGYEGIYEVSDQGRVRSLDRLIEMRNGTLRSAQGVTLRASVDRHGYPRVTLSSQGRSDYRSVHTLVAHAFLPHPPAPTSVRAGGFTVNHIDSDRCNNHASNLEFILHSENLEHARIHGSLTVVGEGNGHAKLTEQDVRDIRRLHSRGDSRKALGSRYQVDVTTISDIVRRRNWSHVD